MHVMIRLYQVLYDITSRVEKYRRSLFYHPLLMTWTFIAACCTRVSQPVHGFVEPVQRQLDYAGC
jgi:hypothetical protein